MVRGRQNLAHKCAETTSNKIGSIFLHLREKGESHTLTDKHQGSFVLPFENVGNKERKYHQIEQRDLVLYSKLQYGFYSRIPAFRTEYSSRQRIKKKSILFRVASLCHSFSSGFSTTRFSDKRSICFPPMPTTTSIYIPRHPDPYSQGTDAMIQNWKVGLPYAFPPFSMISRELLKIKQECVPPLMLIAPVWSTQPWYPELLNLCVREPMLLPHRKEILITPKNIVHPLMIENSITQRLGCFQENPFV